MSIRLGTTDPSSFRLGNTAVSKLMLGNTEVWSSAFDPLSLSPALWLDASDANTLFDAVSGGSLVAADGTIARWEDKSGNSRHVTQATSGLRPTRRTGIKNGKDIVRFGDESSVKWMRSSFSISQPFTMVAVVSSGTYSSFNRSIIAGVGGGLTPTIGVNATPRLNGYAGSVIISSASLPTSYIAAFQASGASSTLHQNGSLVGSGNAGAGTIAGATVGAWGSAESASFFIGDICECFIFPSTLSTTNRQALELYLNSKWAIY